MTLGKALGDFPEIRGEIQREECVRVYMQKEREGRRDREREIKKEGSIPLGMAPARHAASHLRDDAARLCPPHYSSAHCAQAQS